MPWPMVHFAIAEQVSGGSASPALLLGSIAPDAIHARADTTREDKRKTHLMTDDGQFPELETLRREILSCLSEASSKEWRQYVFGYFLHIYTDIRWTLDLYPGFKARFLGDPTAEGEQYKRESSQIEFILMRSQLRGNRVLLDLEHASAYPVPALVTEEEVEKYRDAKLDWLREAAHEPRIKPAFFTEEVVRSFIEGTSFDWITLTKEWGMEM